ncbi:diguanylate cyclase [Xenophilus arseniciresistens]|uniref:diguanylate cyclase n=1 Tax=Xenophilus arseniciresistens TaxID=1283306 RepID=A0AAE3NB64_9BURK|nr:diguanylate cyclase [Xenophilus arseniciresistens]MDA7417671.1 diguanylate cyclase [Xenophilus arseniciresistens]
MDSTPPDLFAQEARTLADARAAHAQAGAGTAAREALGELIAGYERLLRETRRLVQRSDRAEREMTQINQRLQELAAELEYRATHDPLTGVLNRAAIIDLVNRLCKTHELSLIVLDIDHFKRVNDSFGHPMGDRVLMKVVDCLRQVMPANASLGRVGGEEFTIALPGRDPEASLRIAHAVCHAIEANEVGLPDGSRVTASLGLSWLPRGGSFDEAYGLADQALYSAKRAGRNRVARAEPRPRVLRA